MCSSRTKSHFAQLNSLFKQHVQDEAARLSLHFSPSLDPGLKELEISVLHSKVLYQTKPRSKLQWCRNKEDMISAECVSFLCSSFITSPFYWTEIQLQCFVCFVLPRVLPVSDGATAQASSVC